MSLTLQQSKTALSPNLTASFLGYGSTALPFEYSVQPGGAGGTIDPFTGVYTAPAAVNSDPSKTSDTIVVVDTDGNKARAKILVGSPIMLFCEIIQQELALDSDHIYLWDQKAMQPNDFGMYLVVSEMNPKAFANISRLDENGDEEQIVNMGSTIGIDIISRGPAARDRKEEVLGALHSIYSQRQQEGNSFYIAPLPTGPFINLSEIDGPAIPYRYRISINIQYAFKKTKFTTLFFDTFGKVPEVTTDP